MPEVDPAWRLTQMDVDTGATKYDLYLELDERSQEVLARFHYNTDLFERRTIERMVEHFRQLLESAVENPDTPVAELGLMSAEERRQVLLEWNQTAEDYARDLTIQQVFEQQVERTPQATALIHAGKRWSYEQINRDANRLGHWLAKQGIGHDSRVGICLERSADTVVALLATLKSGASYVPLDPGFPVDRLQFMMEDAGLACVITQAAVRDKLPASAQKILRMDTEGSWRREASDNLGVSTSSTQVAYIIYTSGSTGRPKGVQGTHRGALNRFAWMWKKYPFQAGEVCCQKTNLGFVDSIWEIFGPLLGGVPSVILSEEAVRDPELLVEELARERVSRLVLVPSLLRALLEHAANLQERLPGLRLWSCSGEILPVELAGKFREVLPQAKLLNIYGSSEVAADVTCHEVEERDLVAASVAIGRPISNTQIYLLDQHRNPVPAGVRGEIYVGGEGLARGYLNRAGTDRGALRGQPGESGAIGTPVPDGRCRPLPLEWGSGICRTGGPAGEAAGAADRVGRDRDGAGAAWGGAPGGGGGDGGGRAAETVGLPGAERRSGGTESRRVAPAVAGEAAGGDGAEQLLAD